jgi:3-methyladenine DNA glycosylase AlkD
MQPRSTLVVAELVRRGLADAADPVKAGPMQAYMKSELPFRGVPAPEQRRVFRAAFAAAPLASFDEWRDAVRELWHDAEFREERYAAIALTEARTYQAWAESLGALPLYEELIVDGAWWDLVDPLATHRIGALLRAYPQQMRGVLIRWSRGDDPWLRRAAILAQIGFRDATDRELLYAVIEPSLGERDFFLRKAIGWALRQYARVEPDEVRSYVRKHEKALSPLSMREALRRIGS